MGLLEQYFDAEKVDKWLVKDEKSVLKLGKSFEYWRYNLLERCMRIFEWGNLPFDQKEIEMRVLTDGWTGFVNDANVGYAVSRGSMNGYFHPYSQI